MILTNKLTKEVKDRPELSYYIEDDVQDILGSIEGEPGSMVIIEISEGETLDINEREVVISKSVGAPLEVNMTSVRKRGR